MSGKTAQLAIAQARRDAGVKPGEPLLGLRLDEGENIIVTGCMDMEQYATAYNEGYADALKHAESLVRALVPGHNSRMRWSSGRDAAARQINAMRKFGTTVFPPAEGGKS